jgi:P-type Ca2+ transporter type 2C
MAPTTIDEGLTAEQATQRLTRLGRNELPAARPPRLTSRVVHQLRDPMIVLLMAAFVLVSVIGDVEDAIIIAAVVALNTTLGIVQEVRAQRAVDALERMAAPRAHVRRDGVVREVPAAEVVPGDLVRLEAGDVVPADLCLVDSSTLQVDESAMTGESVPADRTVGEEVWSGTVITRGRAWGHAVRTGSESGLGRIAALVRAQAPRPTPLQRRLSLLSKQLVAVTGALCVLVLVLAVAQGTTYVDAAVLAVSLGVAAVPESLPAVVTVSLALGAHRMARRSAVVRSLPAVETLGSVNVLASDKTGTLTTGVLTVRRLWTDAGTCTVSGRGHAVAGAVEGSEPATDAAARLMRDAALCNDAALGVQENGVWRAVGDPFDVALLVAAAKLGVVPDALAQRWERVEDSPFDDTTRSMRTVHRDVDGTTIEVVKGAPEALLPILRSRAADAARREADAMAEQGYRVLAVLEDREWIGLIGVVDPPQPSAPAVVADCRAAGIRPLLVTGDHVGTARAIGTDLGILGEGGEVIDGEALARREHDDRVERIEVYARTLPEQKVDIIDAWQSRGAVVAMTGDGVNDAPALRRADIGVAMGGRGTEVARQAADLVLVDDDLQTVVVAVAEGRRIHASIRSFLCYGLAGGLAEVLVILLAPFLAMPIPLTPAMILWINMVTHGLPGVAFGTEPLDPRLMHRPSPPPTRSVLDRTLSRQIAATGALTAAVSSFAGWLVATNGGDLETAVFMSLGLAQLGIALALRAPRSGLRWHERGLEFAVLLAGACQLAGVLVPGLRELLGTSALSGPDLLVVLVLAAVPGLAVSLGQRFVGRGGRAGGFAGRGGRAGDRRETPEEISEPL